MPANRASLRITDAYRRQMVALRRSAQTATEQAWQSVDPADLDATFTNWLGAITTTVSAAQRNGARLSSAYLAAFLASELGHRVRTPTIDASKYVGVVRDGRSLAEAYDSPRIAVLVAIKESAPNPLDAGLQRALRSVGVDTDYATRQSLTDAMAADPRIAGWRRAVRGTCDACLGLADEALAPPGTPLEIHPGCECVSEPDVKTVPDRFPRPSGAQIFAALSTAKQDETFGAEKAQALRDGQIDLSDCVDRSQLATAPDFITGKPLKDTPAAKAEPDQGGRDGR